ncbi:MAG: hypothetical protein LC800_10055 [Acidobacteria bacterium]|nr:hypothetical protein [Acidobacteriota bacterium]
MYYSGRSFGGHFGTHFLAVEPDIRAGVLVVTGGSGIETRRLGINRPGAGSLLAARTPSLINALAVTNLDGVPIDPPHFNENLPLRNGTPLAVGLADGTSHIIESPVINTVAGAIEIQEAFERMEWVNQSANPVAYAPHLRKAPLPNVPAKSVIIQFAKGDQQVPNPGTTALLRAGDLADRATLYRNDLAYAENPLVPKNPHGFQTAITTPALAEIAFGAQRQAAVFFASDGWEVIHPEPSRFFEVPISLPLPEGLNFIP